MADDSKRTRTRATHSLEAVISEAVALLDESGEQALTFRALAARLGGGPASVYWYVSSKDELLDRASDHVLADVLAATEDLQGSDPIDDARTVAVTLFDTIIVRPWLAAYFMRDAEQQPNALRLFDRLGRQVMRLGLTAHDTFDAVSAIIGFVIGTAADLSQQPPQTVRDGSLSLDQHLQEAVARWRALDPHEFPFIHFILDEFATHDDATQFRAGLDLLLDGIRQRAEAG
ncbi:TetR/AcrR family transcriptional regulator C-terminal domain-containing protein [Demequina capsici]|uniref:TetR/AcrR family transcriptional regulator C-terminal domain-containing protein n=1 Tax=Demequina capsici TaxID=3075620 RepID=A0AA96F9B0_9MICO|nr:TetR/AcrR family transcriptional regulator C-terminal domain-containing protein [Demequina sp. PMTSA13]WNM26586.1 TetR/AcrR family transcriptional regulator C-terminal domain-containing protein [Demequina sp. PMTSA13]